MAHGQLVRSRSNRILAGVAGGIAEHLGVSSTAVRVLWIVGGLVGGPVAVLVYAVLMFAIPDEADSPSGVRVAEERYARGEISAEELDRIRKDLRAS